MTPSKQRSKMGLWPWLMGLTVFGLLGLGFLFMAIIVAAAATPHVALIELSGAITDQGAGGLLGGKSGGAREFIAEVEKARRDSSAKAVVIRINSPGGSASASQEMFQAVQRLRQQKPVICSMGDVAASGGYYVAAGCDKIYANASTMTGSIGVISQFLNYGDLFRKLGLDEATIKSGPFKDAGSPTRKLRPQERQLFQAMINDIYGQFVSDVALGRKKATSGKLTREKVRKLADGRVYTGSQAKKLLLVDENGGLFEAIVEAGRRGNLGDSPHVKSYSSGGGLGSLFGASAEGSFDSLAQGMGAAFARGAVQQAKADAQDGALPVAR